MKYSYDSETTREVCKKIGITFDIHFVTTIRRKDKIYVSFTCGKPDEIKLLKRLCLLHGYIFKTGR